MPDIDDVISGAIFKMGHVPPPLPQQPRDSDGRWRPKREREFIPVIEHSFTMPPEVTATMNAAMELSRTTGMDLEAAVRAIQAATAIEYRPIGKVGPPPEPPAPAVRYYNGPESRRIILGD